MTEAEEIDRYQLTWEYRRWRAARGLDPTPVQVCRFALWIRRLEHSVGAGFLALPQGKAESER